MSILNKYKEWKTYFRILYDKYLDFVLSVDDTKTVPLDGKMTEKCLAAYIDTDEKECYHDDLLCSLVAYQYDGSKNDGCTLKDIGFTGVDNGLISYAKGEITNQEFFDIFTGSTLPIPAGDMRFHVKPVTGNTGFYTYDYDVIENEEEGKYYALKGGFLQGFYKLFGFEYETLPTTIEDEWNLEFVLRPRDYEEKDNTLNNTHEDTDGIFFYMGTRAENKFAQFYNTDLSKYETREGMDRYSTMCDDFINGTGYFGWEDPSCSPIDDSCDYWKPLDLYEEIYDDYYKETNSKNCKDNMVLNKKSMFMWQYFFNQYGWNEFSDCNGNCKKGDCGKCKNCGDDGKGENCACEYFSDNFYNSEGSCNVICDTDNGGDYFSDDYKVTPACDNGTYHETGGEYFTPDVSLSGVTVETSEGRGQDLTNYFEIETDNKFITHNRTKTGCTVNTCFDEDGKIILTGVTNTYKGNLFLDVNRTKTGYTVNNLDDLYSTSDNVAKYDILKDIKNNCFALRIRKDGSIGYKYLISDCDAEDGWSIMEEYSFPGIVKKDKWSTINVKFDVLNGVLDECGKPIGPRKIKLYIYVDGYLKLVSKELPDFNFRELNDTFEKQEAVPFNISLGGGSMGLCDSVWLDYYMPFPKVLPIEKNFAGTFIGDIRSFKFYTCSLQYNEIKNNHISVVNKHKRITIYYKI